MNKVEKLLYILNLKVFHRLILLYATFKLHINKFKAFIKKYTYEISMTPIRCMLKYDLIRISLLIEKNSNFIERVCIKMHTVNKWIKG